MHKILAFARTPEIKILLQPGATADVLLNLDSDTSESSEGQDYGSMDYGND